jgi:hypothetical protein
VAQVILVVKQLHEEEVYTSSYLGSGNPSWTLELKEFDRGDELRHTRPKSSSYATLVLNPAATPH